MANITDYSDKELKDELDRRLRERKKVNLVRCQECRHLCREDGWDDSRKFHYRRWCELGVIESKYVTEGTWRKCVHYESRKEDES